MAHDEVCLHSGDAHDSFGNLIRLPARAVGDSDKIIAFFARRSAEGQGFRWAMIEQRSGAFIEVAYHLLPAACGFGYAREALDEALRWASEAGIGQVEAWIEPKNHRSIALIERATFAPTGMMSGGASRYVRSLA